MITGRAEPRAEWLLDALATQAKAGDDLDVIVIDLHNRTTNELGIGGAWRTQGRIPVRVAPPKPTIWQGPHRVTACDWWAKANAINTAIVLARRDYIAFVDDRCVPGPKWLEAVRGGTLTRSSVLCGSYDRLENGRVAAVDNRRTHSPEGRINCGGSWLYGCTWAAPLEYLLGVNGAEEGTDGLGAEDSILGLNLANARRRLDFVPSMFVALERSAEFSQGINGHAVSPAPAPTPKRTDKGVSPHDKSHASLARFGKGKRTDPTLTPNLTELREKIRTGGAFPIPDPTRLWRDWYDDELISTM